MIELIEKRTLTAKHFEDNGQKKLHAHTAHVHYFDKLDSERFRGIDTKLIWDDIKKGWGFKYHSFNPFFPESSDGFAEFRDLFEGKDQTVKYKAIGEKVIGSLITEDVDNPFFGKEGILYKGVFGEDRDYILYNTVSSMIKIATVNNPNEQKEDAVFEWEVELPNKEVFRVDKPIDAEEMTERGTQTNTEDGELVGYRLDTSRSKTFNTNKLTLIGNSELDGKEWFTYLEGYKAWDSEGNTILIEAKLSIEDGKTILRKIIPLEFLQTAAGKVFVDTTTSYTAQGVNSRGLNNYNSNYTVCHDATTATVRQLNADTAAANILHNSTSYHVRRFEIYTDTSSIGSGNTVTAVNVYLKSYASGGGDTNGYSIITLDNTNNSNLSDPLIEEDFDDFGTTSIGSADLTSFTNTGTWGSIALTDFNVVDVTGNSRVGLRLSGDINSTTPSGSNVLRIDVGAGTTYPYLEVTYSSGPSAPADDAIFFGCNF